MAFIKVCSLSELPNNSQKIVPLGPHKVALFHFNNEISAIANACLHKAGPLGFGIGGK
jgi:nitrite reductase/ring-hydroxylating ferredoxin subunit